MKRRRIDAPVLRSRWQPVDSGPSLSEPSLIDASTYDLPHAAGLVQAMSDRALDRAEEALIRLDCRDVLVLLRADGEGSSEDDDEDLLQRWGEQP